MSPSRWLAVSWLSIVAPVCAQNFTPAENPPPVKPLSAAEEAKTFQVPPGYRLELVLSEPTIAEPVAMAFDAEGRLYVAEMRSYMRDLDATDELKPVGRVSVHWSSKNNGVYDQHRVFAENLLLPRLLLPLADGVVIGETNTNDLYLYEDKNRDGVAEGKKLVYQGGERGGNMEHQPSGLTWGIDNWLYSAMNNYRLRWKDGQFIKQDIPSNGGQWGGTQDDDGKYWVVNAGGEKGPLNFQQHIQYGRFASSSQFEPGFEVVWPAMGLGDFQGGTGKARQDGTLNHFTATCGGEIYRGDRLPGELKGNLFFAEPVGRLIRRTQIEVNDGLTILHNPHGQSEFLRSTDACFRPVEMKTAPDGTLYICDMYRGVIQEGAWTPKGGYLRKVIESYAMEKIIDRGRIWRLVHESAKPQPAPSMLKLPSAQLVAALAHPNGWYRDTVQKLLVLRGDKSVVPVLEKMLQSHASPLARLHALWTLEGLGVLTPAHVRTAFKDAAPQVRKGGIRASESLAEPALLQAEVMALAKDSDPSVVLQSFLTAKFLKWKDYQKFIAGVAQTSTSKGVKAIAAQILTDSSELPGQLSSMQRESMGRGEAIYQELCFTCHGLDGKGTSVEGLPPGTTLAPALAGDKVVLGSREGLIQALLHGVTGPVGGKTFQGQMIPMGSNTDQWLADVATYVRNRFNNAATPIEAKEVAQVRAATAGRTQPWTEAELQTAGPALLGERTAWKLTTSDTATDFSKLLDGDLKTRWSSAQPMADKMWLTIELPAETEVNGVRVNFTERGGFWEKRSLRVETSADGQTWSKPLFNAPAVTGLTEITFAPTKAKYVRLTQTGSGDKKTPWNIHELNLTAPAAAPGAKVAASR